MPKTDPKVNKNLIILEGRPSLPVKGATGIEFYAGQLNSLDPNAEFKDPRVWIPIAHEMWWGYARISGIVHYIIGPTMALNWSIESAKDKDGKSSENDIMIAQKIEQNLFKRLQSSWKKVIFHAALSVVYGFFPFEIHWSVLNDEMYVWDLEPRLPQTIHTWGIKPTGQLEYFQQFVQMPNMGYRVTDPIMAEDCVLFTYQGLANNFLGRSILRSSWFFWRGAKETYLTNQIGLERAASGYLDMEESPGMGGKTEERTILRKIGQNFRNHQLNYLIRPNGTKVQYIFPQGYDAAGVLATIEHLNMEMTQATLTDFMNSGRTKYGDRSTAITKVDVCLMALQSIPDMICEEINRQLIRQMVDKNWSPDNGYPELKCSQLSQLFSTVQVVEYMKEFTAAGLIIPDGDGDDEHARDLIKWRKRSTPIAQVPPMPQSKEPQPPKKQSSPVRLSASGYFRAIRSTEKVIALNEIERFLDGIEAKMMQQLKEPHEKMLDNAIKSAAKTYPNLNDVAIKMPREFRAKAKEITQEALYFGRSQIESERQRALLNIQLAATDEITAPAALESQKQARAWIDSTLDDLIKSMEDDAFAIITQEFRDLKRRVNEAKAADIEERLQDRLNDELINTQTRLVREIVSSSFNMGRHLEAALNFVNVKRVEYSAILDKSTCETCKEADAKYQDIQPGSEDYFKLMPPNARCKSIKNRRGNMCRCFYVFVFKDEVEPVI